MNSPSIDDNGRRRLLEKIVGSGPSETHWRELLDVLASWPDNSAKAQSFDWLHRQLESWPDEIKTVNSAWTHIYADDGKLSQVAALIRSVTIAHREQYGNKELLAIVQTPGIRDIQTLVISKSDIYLQGIRELIHSPYLSNLKTLILEGLVFSDEKLETLFSATNLPSLVKLRLKDMGLNTGLVQRLLSSPLIGPVKDLELPYNQLDDQTALILAVSTKVKQLRTLDLTGNFIGEKGRLALTNSIPNILKI